jgi:hypothetical protein
MLPHQPHDSPVDGVHATTMSSVSAGTRRSICFRHLRLVLKRQH